MGMNVSKRIAAAMPQQHEVKVETTAAGRLRRRRWLDDVSTWDIVGMIGGSNCSEGGRLKDELRNEASYVWTNC